MPRLSLCVTGKRDSLPLETQLLLRFYPFRLQTYNVRFKSQFPNVQEHIAAGSGFFNVGNGDIQCIYCGLSVSADTTTTELVGYHNAVRRFCPGAHKRLCRDEPKYRQPRTRERIGKTIAEHTGGTTDRKDVGRDSGEPREASYWSQHASTRNRRRRY